MNELRYALRRLLAAPGTSVVAVVTLGLGLAATAAVFAVVYPVLLAPLPFTNPHGLVRVYNHPKGNLDTTYEVSYPTFRQWRDQSRSFVDLAGFASSAGGLVVEIGGTAQRIEGKYVSWNLFSLLGVQPVEGRLLAPRDDVAGAEPVVVLSESVWRQKLGADPSVVGTTLKVGGTWRRIVGLVPEDFEYPPGARIWVPAASELPSNLLENTTVKFWNVLGRLEAGTTTEQARLELDSITDATTNLSLPQSAQSQVTLGSLEEELTGSSRGPLLFLLGAAALVLLVAVANVANLQTVTTIGRQRELAVRQALGAARRDLVRQSLAESVILALAGGALGLLVAGWGVKRLLALSPLQFFRQEAIGLGATVIVFALVFSLAAALLSGLVPALYSARESLVRALNEASGRTTGGPAARRLLRGFVVLQISLAVVLLVGAGLLVRSFMILKSVDPGFDRRGVLTFSLPLSQDRFPEPQAHDRLYEELVARLRTLPGVEAAAGVLLRPLQSLGGYDYPMTIEGRPFEEQSGYPLFNYQAVTPGYFEALGIPLVAGRVFAETDDEDAPPVVILSRSVAERFWPHESPVGQRVKWTGPDSPAPWVEVVGVVGDSRYRRIEEVSLNLYVPHRQSPWPLNPAVVRTAGDPRAVAGSVRDRVNELALGIAVALALTRILSSLFSQVVYGISLLDSATFAAVPLVLLGAAALAGLVPARRASRLDPATTLRS